MGGHMPTGHTGTIRRLKPEDRELLATTLRRSYEEGHSIRFIAARATMPYGTVRNLLREAGTALRSRGGNNRSKQ